MTCSTNIKNNPLTLKLQKDRQKLTAGFSLVEMTVTMGIFMIMTTVMYANYPQLNRVIALQAATSEIGVIIRNAQIYGSSRGGGAVGDGVYFDINSAEDKTKLLEFLDVPVPNKSLNDFGIATSDRMFTQNILPDPNADDKIVNYTKISGGVIINGLYKKDNGGFVSVDGKSVSIVYVRPNTEAYIFENPLGSAPNKLSELYIETSSGNVANPAYRCITVLKIGQVNVTSGKCSTLFN